jgi:rhodanese-related sulfurtransferase
MNFPPTSPRNRSHLPTLIAAIVLLLSACGGSGGSGGSGGTDDASPTAAAASAADAIPPDDFATFIAENPDAPLVNVHIPYEGHIEGTDSFVAFDEISDWDGLPSDKDAPLAIYCRSGNMSATAGETLANLGYLNVVDLQGGMKAWSAAGYDLLDDEPSPN